MENTSMLAKLLYNTWRLSDPELRSDLERAIKAHVKQHPEFLPYLEKAMASYTPASPRSDRLLYELAGVGTHMSTEVMQHSTDEQLLHELAASFAATWYFADNVLRKDIEEIIRRLVRRQPQMAYIFKQVDQPGNNQATSYIRRISP
jgi:hypothetical protein